MDHQGKLKRNYMATLSINNAVTGQHVVLCEVTDCVSIKNSASDPLVPKLRELLTNSVLSDLELRIDGQSQAEHHFESVRQTILKTLERTIDDIKTSSLR